jgi:hypothetical protein
MDGASRPHWSRLTRCPRRCLCQGPRGSCWVRSSA